MFKNRQIGIFFAALIIAIGGIIYELIIGTVSSYLLGDSVLQFSITIGLILFGMGLGSLLAPKFTKIPEQTFVIVESLIALIGGNAAAILFAAYAYTPYFYPLFISMLLIVGTLIGFEIPTMFQIVSNKKQMVTVLSKILALDYVGSLIASIAFPLLLLPYFGIIRSSYLVGLTNLAIAILMFISFKDKVQINHKILTFYLGICLLTLSFGTFQSNLVAAKLDHKLYQDEVIHSAQTQYQKIVITKFQDDVRLYLNGNIQFSSIDEYRYHEPLVHVPMNLARNPQNILVLGGGDGLVTKQLLKYKGISHITLVDLDPAMTTLASTHPLLTTLNQNSLTHPKVTVINQDALYFLETTSNLYEVIIIDLPDPNNEALAKLYSKEFYRLVKRHLAEDGVMVTQATSPYFSANTFWLINQTLESEDLQTIPYHSQVPSFGEWGFIAASKYKKDISTLDIPVTTNYLTAAIIPTLFVFDNDLIPQAKSTEINSFMNPVILQYYSQDARRWEP